MRCEHAFRLRFNKQTLVHANISRKRYTTPVRRTKSKIAFIVRFAQSYNTNPPFNKLEKYSTLYIHSFTKENTYNLGQY